MYSDETRRCPNNSGGWMRIVLRGAIIPKLKPISRYSYIHFSYGVESAGGVGGSRRKPRPFSWTRILDLHSALAAWMESRKIEMCLTIATPPSATNPFYMRGNRPSNRIIARSVHRVYGHCWWNVSRGHFRPTFDFNKCTRVQYNWCKLTRKKKQVKRHGERKLDSCSIVIWWHRLAKK